MFRLLIATVMLIGSAAVTEAGRSGQVTMRVRHAVRQVQPVCQCQCQSQVDHSCRSKETCKEKGGDLVHKVKTVEEGVWECTAAGCRPATRSEVSTKVRTVEKYRSSGLQDWAEKESRLQASSGYMGHIRGSAPGARFTGVGYSSSPHNIQTCTPLSGGVLVGDSTVRGANGMYYRTRVWK